MDESVIKHLEAPQVGTIKLSDAIRIGARIRPQCTGDLFRNGASCALGAAYEAVYGHTLPDGASFSTRTPSGQTADAALITAFPILRENEVVRATWKLNDSGAPREAVADMLEAQGL